MSDVKWAPDGKSMFGKLMNAVPEAMRDMVKPQLLQLLGAKAAGKPVTSEIITRMVQEDLPEPQRGIIMQALGIKPPKEKKAEKKRGKHEVHFHFKTLRDNAMTYITMIILIGEF